MGACGQALLPGSTWLHSPRENLIREAFSGVCPAPQPALAFSDEGLGMNGYLLQGALAECLAKDLPSECLHKNEAFASRSVRTDEQVDRCSIWLGW